MIDRLKGPILHHAVGKTIESIVVDTGDAPHVTNQSGNGALTIRFSDGTGIVIADDYSMCCETRYMSTDDDLSAFVGARLVGAEVREGPTTELGNDDAAHETAFLVVMTSLGAFTCVTHNEHNGYYSGFAIRVSTVE